MRASSRSATLAVALLLLASRVDAQATRSFDPLALPPAAALRCKVPQGFNGPNPTFDFVVADSVRFDTNIRVSFTPDGEPRRLEVAAPETPRMVMPGRMHAVEVEFMPPPPSGIVFLVTGEEKGKSFFEMIDDARSRQQPLDEAQLARARELALFLWTHRCSRSIG